MPSVFYKFTMEFQSTVGNDNTSGALAGWSEQFYSAKSYASDKVASDNLRKYAAERISLLTPGWTNTVLRGSQLDANFAPTRKGFLIAVKPGEGKGTYNKAADKIDEQPYDAINLSLSSTDGHRRSFLMRGIGNDLINAGGRFLNPPAWAGAFPSFAGFLKGTGPEAGDGGGTWEVWDGLAIRFRTSEGKDLPTDIFNSPTDDHPKASELRPVLRFATPVGLGAATFLKVSGVTGMSGINGVWEIDSQVDGPIPVKYRDFVLKPKRRTRCVGVAVAKGVVIGWRYGIDPIVEVTAGQGASRRTGRPSNIVRGRRSNRP